MNFSWEDDFALLMVRLLPFVFLFFTVMMEALMRG